METYNSTYWWAEYVKARLKVQEIHQEILGLKRSENDNDKIEFDPDSLKKAIEYEAYCKANYNETKAEEDSTVSSGLTYLGNGYYGI